MSPTRYRDAGVDIDAGEEAIRRIKKTVRSTFGPHVVTEIGAFAGVSRIPGVDPGLLLVGSMDGVGTKLKVAARVGRYGTVGEDLVNHCAGDIGVHGADPLFFLDYVGMGKLEPAVVEQVVEGLARGCRANGCALIGGETAEMPGIYAPGDFDLVGTIVGTLRREDYVDGSSFAPGDRLLGFPSTGLHTNGFSLARRVLFDDANLDPLEEIPGTGRSLADHLLAVHRSYLPELRALRGLMKGAAHITGGGIPGNLARILRPGIRAAVDVSLWPVPPVMKLIAERGSVPRDDLYRTLNMGIGLIVGVPGDRVAEARERTPDAIEIGTLEAGESGVDLRGEPAW